MRRAIAEQAGVREPRASYRKRKAKKAPRALDRNRLIEGPLTHLIDAEMQAVERSLKAVLGML